MENKISVNIFNDSIKTIGNPFSENIVNKILPFFINKIFNSYVGGRPGMSLTNLIFTLERKIIANSCFRFDYSLEIFYCISFLLFVSLCTEHCMRYIMPLINPGSILNMVYTWHTKKYIIIWPWNRGSKWMVWIFHYKRH